LQWGIGGVGFRFPSVVEVIAPQGVGKTTFAYYMMGAAIRNGCYVLYVECEGKDMRRAHVARIMSSDKRTARVMLNAIETAKARTIAQCDHALLETIPDMRARCDADPDTKGNPIFVVVDTWSSLLSPAEAKGIDDWGVSATAKRVKPKDVGTMSNMGHAKAAHYMKRYMPSLIEKNNAIVVIMKHQSEDVDMSGFGPPVRKAAKRNTSSIGGYGHDDIAHYILTLTPQEKLKDSSRNVYGQRVNLFFEKNAYGAPYRDVQFDLVFDKYQDTEETYDPVVRLGETTALWMVRNGILGTRVSSGLYTCKDLGVTAVTGDALYKRLLANPELLDMVGEAMKIEGYPMNADEKKQEAGN
jgi:RecA/RadA recombinase